MPEENKDLILGIFFLFADNVNCINNWGFYLFSTEFKNEPELRNKIGSIWITSLLDSLEGESRTLENYKKEATEKGLQFLLPVCEQANKFLDTVKEILALYTKAEQLFLIDFRDQLVHSWLGKRHVKQLNIKYFDGKKIIKEKISRAEHNGLIKPFYEIDDMDKAVQPLINRFTNRNLLYWQILGDIQQGLPSLRESMLKGRPYYFRSLSSNSGSAADQKTADMQTQKIPTMIDSNHKLTDSDYLKHLKQQYDFLISDIEQYEKGFPHFAVKIAATIRTIFHSSPISKAILPYLAQKHGHTVRFRKRQQKFVLDDACTLYMGFFFGFRDIPKDYFNESFFIDTDFETYWNEIVYKERSIVYTRKQIILFAANKWGGSHVDPEIPRKFLHLTNGSGPKLISEQCGEEMLFCRIAYETAIQTIILLEDIIPALDKTINHNNI